MNENHDERGRFASAESYTGARGSMPRVGDKITGRSQGQQVTGVVTRVNKSSGVPVYRIQGRGYDALVGDGSVNKVARGDKTAVKWAKNMSALDKAFEKATIYGR